MRDVIEELLAQKHIAIVGVTRDEKGWGRALYDAFKKRGYDTYAVNPARSIRGIQCYGSLRDLPEKPDAVICAVPPNVTDQVVRECAELGIPRVWMHRGIGTGAVSPAAIRYCQEHHIAVVYGVCPMMYLKPRGIGHGLHHWVARWRGQLPEGA